MATDPDIDQADPSERTPLSKEVALAELDTMTAIQLGQALFCTLAGATDEPDLDEIRWEDAGVSLNGFVELPDYDSRDRVLELLERLRPST